MNSQGWVVGCAVIAIFIGGLVAFPVPVPEVAEQLPPGDSSHIVTLSTLLKGAQVPLKQFIAISAEALGGKPIAAFESWIDGTPSETNNAPAGSPLNQNA